MYFEINKIVKRLQGSEIVIYGAGVYAEKIYEVMEIYGIQSKVQYFVVSETGEGKCINGIPVISIGQLNEMNKKFTIFVAVSISYVAEIREILKDFKAKEIFYLTDYEKADEELLPWVCDRGADEFANYVLNGLISNQRIRSQRDLKKAELLFQTEIQGDMYDSKRKNMRIIFFVGIVTARTARIAAALKNAGYKIDVFKMREEEYIGESELKKQEIRIKHFAMPLDILYEVMQIHPFVCYLEPFGAEYQICAVMIAFRQYFGKIIWAPYDIRNGTVLEEDGRINELEKYCFENADGIIWRYFAQDFLEKRFGFSYKGISVFIPDCCESYSTQKHSENDCLKLCCMPTHTSDVLETDTGESTYTHEATLWEILDKVGNQEDCVFHVFFWNVSEREKALLEQFKRKYYNFDYFVHIEHKQLIENVLPKYDYGCSLNTAGKIPIYPESIMRKGIKYSENALRYGSSNKFYDFISAGLPVIATIPERLCHYLDQYGVIVDMDVEHLDIGFLKEHKTAYQVKVASAKPKLVIENYVPMLVGFLEQLRNI